jgi:hypothetical protein
MLAIRPTHCAQRPRSRLFYFCRLGFAAARRPYRQFNQERRGNGNRHGKVVQPDQRLWIYSAARRRQGRIRISAVEKAGLSTLNEGQQVQYEEVANKGETSAENLKVK